MNKAQIAVGAMFPIIVVVAVGVGLAGTPPGGVTDLRTQLVDDPAPSAPDHQPQAPDVTGGEPTSDETRTGGATPTGVPSTATPSGAQATPNASNSSKTGENPANSSQVSANSNKTTQKSPGTGGTAPHSNTPGSRPSSTTQSTSGSGGSSTGSSGSNNSGSGGASGESGTGGASRNEAGQWAGPADGKMVAFDPNSWLYQSVRSAPVDPNSAAYVKRLHHTVRSRYLGVAAVNSHQYNSSFYVASPGTPKVDVAFNDCQNKGWLDEEFKRALQDVPIPADAVPAAGDDKHLTIYDPAQDVMWEFWVARKSGNNWSACWGGRLDNVSASQGYFTGMYGSTATGISQAATAISVEQAQRGKITHAMCLVVVDAKKWTEHSWPAQRSDGHVDAPDAMPEGRRLRLDPTVNVDALGLTPFAKTVAKAAQEYGFVVCDKGGAVAVVTESGEQEKARTGVNPWDEMFGDTPAYEQMTNFPWDRLQVMPANYGKP